MLLLCVALMIGGLGDRQPQVRPEEPPLPVRIETFASPAGGNGSRWTLAVRMSVPADLHVYAENGSGYEGASLAIVPVKGMRASKAKWPEPTDFFFALSQPLKVYEGTVEAVVVVDLAPAQVRARLAGKEVRVNGKLRYQACTDDTCLRPREAVIRWVIPNQRVFVR